MISRGKRRKQNFSFCPSLLIMSFGMLELPPSSGRFPKVKNLLRQAPEKKLISISEHTTKCT